MSSYFLFKKVNAKSYESEGLIKKYLKRNLFLYFYWSLVYSPFIVASLWKENFSLKAIFNYFREFFIRGNSYGQLWFIAALVQGMFVIYILRRFLKIRSIFIFSVIVYLTGLAIMPYYGFFETMIYSNRARFSFYRFPAAGRPFKLFYGLPILALGALVAEKQPAFQIAGLPGTMVSWPFLPRTLFTAYGYMFEALQFKPPSRRVLHFSFVRRSALKPSRSISFLEKLSSLVYFVSFLSWRYSISACRVPESVLKRFSYTFHKNIDGICVEQSGIGLHIKVSDIIPLLKNILMSVYSSLQGVIYEIVLF